MYEKVRWQSKMFKRSFVEPLFNELLEPYEPIPSKKKAIFEDLYRRYNKGRYYHGIFHIERMCRLWETHKDKLFNPEAVLFAIFYHDIIYRVHRHDNEEKSAEYFEKKFKTLLGPVLIDVVKELIIATKHNAAAEEIYSKNRDARYLLDFDLEILGEEDAELYDWYRKGVRKEYRMYPKFLYNAGRIKVLKSFLIKKKIYLTPEFVLREKNLRNNLKNEINLLSL
jgi:predicted metal-dependent HD superfamily phosphohydrolase